MLVELHHFRVHKRMAALARRIFAGSTAPMDYLHVPTAVRAPATNFVTERD